MSPELSFFNFAIKTYIMHISESHPANIFKFCPSCGNQGFYFDGIKAFDCPACGFKYYINEATACAAIVVAPDGFIVLSRRKNDPKAGYFDLPGGFVDIGERAEDGLIRELKEELNLDVSEIEFLASFPNEYKFKGISYFTCDLAFVCHVNDISCMVAADDVAEAIWVDPLKIDYETVSFPSIVNILKLYKKKLQKLPD
jgi:ADP-ribose pyrophosphatase YjhB (NUDIX family)